MLIPEVLLRREQLKLDLESIFSLTKTFKCSLEAAAWKLLNMRDWKGALLLWRIDRSAGSLTARIVAMPRTLSLILPFNHGMVISESDINWPAVVDGSRRIVVLQTRDREVGYSAQRRRLGKNSVATLIRLSKSNESQFLPDKQLNRQNELFLDSKQVKVEPSKRIVDGPVDAVRHTVSAPSRRH